MTHRAGWALVLSAGLLWGTAGGADEDATSQEVARLLSTTNGKGGNIDGAPASLNTSRVGTKFATHTQTTLLVNIAAPLRMVAQRRTPALEKAEHEKPVLVVVNDAAFDAGYEVVGAPSDLVRALLDEPTRQAFVALPDVIVALDDRWLGLTIQHPLASPDEAQRLVALATLLVRHLHAGVSPAPGAELSADARAQELAAYQHRQTANTAGAVVPAFFIGVFLIGLLTYNFRRRRRRS